MIFVERGNLKFLLLKGYFSFFTIKVQRSRAVSVDLLNDSLQLLLGQLTVQLLQDLLQGVGGDITEHVLDNDCAQYMIPSPTPPHPYRRF